MSIGVDEIVAALPELELISDPDLRDKVLAVWVELGKQSRFERLSDLPVSPDVDYPHIPHNRCVVRMVVAVAEVLAEYHGTEIDRDSLVAGALLQDACKLVEFEPGENGVQLSELGQSLSHAVFGAHIALQVGLPVSTAESIVDHTYASGRFPRTLEAKLLFYLDQVDMAALGGDRWVKKSQIYR